MNRYHRFLIAFVASLLLFAENTQCFTRQIQKETKSPFRRGNPFKSDSSSNDYSDRASVSQLEDLIVNSKSINILRKTGEVAGPSMAAGAAVALAMVPEAVAFSFVAGVNPLVGLWTTVFLGFVAAATGGRAGICSSASGACSVVIAALCRSHGPAYLSGCAILAGLLQISGGLLGLGKYVFLLLMIGCRWAGINRLNLN